MAGNSTISISFNVADGENGLKKLTVDANELCKVMQATVGISTELQKKSNSVGKILAASASSNSTMDYLCFSEHGLIAVKRQNNLSTATRR